MASSLKQFSKAVCKPSSVPISIKSSLINTSDDHLSRPAVANRLKQPTRERYRLLYSQFGLAPDGVYHAFNVTIKAVSSYLAFSTLSRKT